MSEIDITVLDSAFVALQNTPYELQSTISQYDAEGNQEGQLSQHSRFELVDGEQIQTAISLDREGVLDSDSTERAGTPANALSSILSENPDYLNVRTRDRYVFRLTPDTTINGRSHKAVQASLLASFHNELPTRTATYFVDSLDVLQGLDVERITNSTLFQEDSRTTIWLQKTPNEVLIPATITTSTLIDTAGRSAKRLVTTQLVTTDQEDYRGS